MRAFLAACLAAASLCACSQGSGSTEEAAAEAAASIAAAPSATLDMALPPGSEQARPAPPPPPPGEPATRQPASSRPPGAQPGTPAGAPLLAYTYDYQIEAPAAAVRSLLRRHEQACQNAGPAVCQVVDAGSEQQGDNELAAGLTFRAIPAYVQRFRAGLEREVEGARGEVLHSGIDTEDLTRSIVDTEAGLRAGRLLRERLEGLIASRPGNLQQLLEIERELARVQGEIDAAESALSVMRARVAMSTVTLNYASRGAVVDGGDARPLRDAGDAFVRNFAASLAAIITALSVLLPWLLLIALAGWAIVALARRHRRRSAKPTGSAPARPADFGAEPAP